MDSSVARLYAWLRPRPQVASDAGAALAFQVRRTTGSSLFHHLALFDGPEQLGHWVMVITTNQLSCLPRRLLLMQADPTELGPLVTVEEGEIRLGAPQPGPTARYLLRQGCLQLEFRGNQLRGYFQLKRSGPDSARTWWLQSNRPRVTN